MNPCAWNLQTVRDGVCQRDGTAQAREAAWTRDTGNVREIFVLPLRLRKHTLERGQKFVITDAVADGMRGDHTVLPDAGQKTRVRSQVDEHCAHGRTVAL
jgi:hypothetical protein